LTSEAFLGLADLMLETAQAMCNEKLLVVLGGGSRTDLATAVIPPVIARLVGDSPVGKKVGGESHLTTTEIPDRHEASFQPGFAHAASHRWAYRVVARLPGGDVEKARPSGRRREGFSGFCDIYSAV